ncbi:MAG: hypothetical protein HZB46_13215 [Solirubrobacterales bacterium]|nr:hypothetical protein [Solirubrobacterales bacterium]
MAALLTSAVLAPAALAETANFGRNLGEQARGLAVALFLAVAGLVALPVLGRRDVNGGVVLALLVIVLGGFVFAQGSVREVIVSLWTSLVS